MTITQPLNTQQASNAGLIEHLIFSSPTDPIESQYGLLTYAQYVEAEAYRIGKAPGRTAAVVRAADGQVALFVNDIANIN
jgi:hypothetical protein